MSHSQAEATKKKASPELFKEHEGQILANIAVPSKRAAPGLGGLRYERIRFRESQAGAAALAVLRSKFLRGLIPACAAFWLASTRLVSNRTKKRDRLA